MRHKDFKEVERVKRVEEGQEKVLINNEMWRQL